MSGTFSTTDPYVKQVVTTPFSGPTLTFESFTQNGQIGMPEVTVDVASTFAINQQDQQIQLYIYWPTDQSTIKMYTVVNTGGESFTLTDQESLYITVPARSATMIVFIPNVGYTQLVTNTGA